MNDVLETTYHEVQPETMKRMRNVLNPSAEYRPWLFSRVAATLYQLHDRYCDGKSMRWEKYNWLVRRAKATRGWDLNADCYRAWNADSRYLQLIHLLTNNFITSNHK